MCYTIRIPYACAYDPSVAEKECPGYNARRIALQDSSASTYSPPPVVRYCPEGEKRADDGQPRCPWTSESIEAQDEIICPLKCPTCWDTFIGRLRLSTEETETIWNRIFDGNHHEIVAEGTLETTVNWITADFADSIIEPCIQNKMKVERDWDAALLGMLEDGQPLVMKHLVNLPFTGVDYATYESEKEKFSDDYKANGSSRYIQVQ
jgi:hypothetical protein